MELGITLTRKLGAGFFGGEGFILRCLRGPGGRLHPCERRLRGGRLGTGKTLPVDTGCLVCFDESVQYSIKLAGVIATSIFGNEGLFLPR